MLFLFADLSEFAESVFFLGDFTIAFPTSSIDAFIGSMSLGLRGTGQLLVFQAFAFGIRYNLRQLVDCVKRLQVVPSGKLIHIPLQMLVAELRPHLPELL